MLVDTTFFLHPSELGWLAVDGSRFIIQATDHIDRIGYYDVVFVVEVYYSILRSIAYSGGLISSLWTKQAKWTLNIEKATSQ